MNRLCIMAVVFLAACGGVQRATLQDVAAWPRQLTPRQLNDAIYDANQQLFEAGKEFGQLLYPTMTGESEFEKLKAAHQVAEKTFRTVETQIKALEPRLPSSQSARDFYQAFLSVLEVEGKVILESDREILAVAGDEALSTKEKDERITKIIEPNREAAQEARKRLVKAFEAFSHQHGIRSP